MIIILLLLFKTNKQTNNAFWHIKNTFLLAFLEASFQKKMNLSIHSLKRDAYIINLPSFSIEAYVLNRSGLATVMPVSSTAFGTYRLRSISFTHTGSSTWKVHQYFPYESLFYTDYNFCRTSTDLFHPPFDIVIGKTFRISTELSTWNFNCTLRTLKLGASLAKKQCFQFPM